MNPSNPASQAPATPGPGPIPVTVLTGFLGSGKTTLLNRLLQEPHGRRIAVIENEFGEASIDHELLRQDADEQIIEMNNGCVCCSVRGDLIRILGELAERRRSGALRFDHVVIETTGLADPAPVAQTFFVDDEVAQHYALDAIVTLVDAVHAPSQLDTHSEAQEQVAFADRILVTKSDLVSAEQLGRLHQRLLRMNPRAQHGLALRGESALQVLDVKGFDLDAILDIEPGFLDPHGHHHHHDDEIGSFVFRERRAMDIERLDAFLSEAIQTYGPQLLRYKGVLHVQGYARRHVLQGVHMLLANDLGAPWAADETPGTTLVFIGRRLPQQALVQGLLDCVAQGELQAAVGAAAPG